MCRISPSLGDSRPNGVTCANEGEIRHTWSAKPVALRPRGWSDEGMIPPTWTPHRRQDDEELVGYLVAQGDAVLPVTVFGYPLSEATDIDSARAVLESTGLSSLADPWQLRLDDGQSIRVRIREASADRLVVVPDDFGYGGPLTDAVLLDVPDGGRLTR